MKETLSKCKVVAGKLPIAPVSIDVEAYKRGDPDPSIPVAFTEDGFRWHITRREEKGEVILSFTREDVLNLNLDGL